MKPFVASFINAIILISLGLWAYFSSESPSVTSLIPVFVGVVLLLISPGVKKEAKIPAHIAVVLTLVVFLGLIKALMGALDRNNTVAVIRVVIMLLSTAIALITFIRSFIEVRKQRALEEEQNNAS
ncbi:MAG: hypothetical protein HRT67_00550 [Flavobacteriaceae bacterium]|nr:hypothetical protein [Flavobacteriaceae bacterium]